MQASNRNQRGAVFVEKLIAYLPLLLAFFAAWELAELSAAKLVVQRACSAAGRAAAVVLPDDPVYYDGEPTHSFDGRRRDDIELAAAMVLSAIPRLRADFELEVSTPPDGLGGSIEVTLAAPYDCSAIALFCDDDGAITLTATSQHAYHGAKYAYASPSGGIGGASNALVSRGGAQRSGYRASQGGATPMDVDPPQAGNSGACSNGGNDKLSSAFGSDPLSLKAIDYRCDEGLFTKINVASLEYVNQEGQVKIIADHSQQSGRHSEKNLWAQLPDYVRNDPNKYILNFYTEREPCGKDVANCRNWIREDRPDEGKKAYNGPVTYHADYPEYDKKGREAGNKDHKQMVETAVCLRCRDKVEEFNSKRKSGKIPCDKRIQENPNVSVPPLPSSSAGAGSGTGAGNGAGAGSGGGGSTLGKHPRTDDDEESQGSSSGWSSSGGSPSQGSGSQSSGSGGGSRKKTKI